MGALGNADGSFPLSAHHLVGRSVNALLRLLDASISFEHAALRWSGSSWVIKDLGSTNGTFLNGSQIVAGAMVPLRRDSELRFGRDPRSWVLIDDSPPQPMMVQIGGGAVLYPRDGIFALPSEETPEVVIYPGDSGAWTLERGSEVLPFAPEHPVEIGGAQFRLLNAELVLPTEIAALAPRALSLDDVTLCFRVTRDEEHVELSVAAHEQRTELGVRSHNYLLLTLARRRLADQVRGEPAVRAGWIDDDELRQSLRTTAERLNLDIFRARKQFGAAGIVPPAGIVQRRAGARQVRIGASHLTVEVI